MEEPGHGVLGREGELARMRSFIGSASEGPAALLLEGAAGIGKTTLWRAGISKARLSYAALGDLLDFELPDLPGSSSPSEAGLDLRASPSLTGWSG
jgi:hypothetical protein